MAFPLASPGLNNLTVELLYEVQLYALSDTLPHVSRHLYQVFKSAPPSFHAQYILGRIMINGFDRFVSRALRYPLCTKEVFSALRRRTDCPQIEVNAREFGGQSALTLAAGAGLKRAVGLLLAQDDINVNDVGWYGITPLGAAARRGHVAVVKLLVARDDIDLNIANRWGQTALSLAVEKGHKQVVDLLLAHDDSHRRE